MTFDNILDQAIEMLQRRGRLTYRTLKRGWLKLMKRAVFRQHVEQREQA